MTTRKNQPPALGDHEFEHGHVLGPILWTVVVYSAAVVLHLLGDRVPPLYVALTGVTASLLAPMVAVFKRFSFLLMASIAGLLTWTTATTPWQQWPPLVAAAGCVVFGMSYHALRSREEKEADNDALATKAATKGKYVDLLELIGMKGLKESKRTPFAAGKTIHLLLPVDGKVKLSQLKDATESLTIAAARAGLQVTFEFEEGSSPAEVLLHVFEHDVLADTLPLEFERLTKSINDPIPLGKFPTGEICVVTFREVAALMVGLKGRGKSGLINTHLAHLTGCTDAVVWMLDGKGGETVRPWLQPFLDMVTTKPVINWAAIDEAEFDAVLLATRAAIKYRTSAEFRPLSFPSAAAPSIILIVEEASVITGLGRYGGANRQQLAQDAVTLGRSSCLDSIFATQRSTLDMLGSGAMKANLDLRYGMGVTDAQDARMVFPDGRMAQSLYRLGKAAKYRGTFLMLSPEMSRVMPAKAFWVDPAVIPGMAQTNAVWAADLDDGTANAVHVALVAAGVPGGYYGRWERLGRAMGCPVPDSVSRPVESSRPAPETRPSETAETPGRYDGSRGTKAVQDAVAASRAKRDDEAFQALWDANFETVEVGDETHLRDVSSAPDNAPPILRCMLAVFRGRGNPDALPTRVLCEELPGDLNPTSLGRLMALCSVSPIPELIWEGKRVRGYTRDSIETSVKRGSWTLGAGDWKP